MGHGALVAIALTMSVATGGAVVGTVVLVSGATSAAGSSAPARVASSKTASAAPTAAASPRATFPDAALAQSGVAGEGVSANPASGTPGASDLGAASSRPGPFPSTSAAASSANPVSAGPWLPPTSASVSPFDAAAAMAGFAGRYRYVVHLSGVAGMMDLGGVVEGTVTDATHFVLDFPESTFITRYTRDGPRAQAVINGRILTVEPGAGTAGAISPEDLLPDQIWLQAIAPWAEALRPDRAGSGYSADAAFLAGLAREHGLFATDWRLSVRTDVAGRVATVAFSGVTVDQAFELDLVMLYG